MSHTTQFDLLRHGACDGGAIYRGLTDVPLNSSGWEQMGVGAGENPGWDRVVSSPLQRCAGFAARISQQQGLPLELCDDLKELDFGTWDGRETTEVWANESEAVTAFWRDPVANPPPGGEPMAVFQHRVLQQIAELEARYGGEKLLLVTHGGVIRVLLCQVLQMPLQALQQMSVDYGSLSRVRCYRETAVEHYAQLNTQLIFHNRLENLGNYEP